MNTDILIVGSGCSGLYCALQLPKNVKITIISKSDLTSNDSFLAQGGICMLKNDSDYESFFEDTMKAGHYENDRESVSIMIKSSPSVLSDLLSYGVDFQRHPNGELAYTREGAHAEKRILYHEDITGKEITRHLLAQAKARENITLLEYTTLIDLIETDNKCYGAIVKKEDGSLMTITAGFTVLATGGVGGLFTHSTNYRHLTGDALAIAMKHQVELKDIDYVQIHPTTLYSSDSEDRSFLISESVRGEGAHLYDKNGNRFVNELLPRDLLTIEIKKQMEKDGTDFVWEDLRPIGEEEIRAHFPNIVKHCKDMGYDVFKECIPVVPAQHYFMGGIKVNHESKTSMDYLYAVGETACNGVHGKNRLASNSLLESLVFAKRAAKDIISSEHGAEEEIAEALVAKLDLSQYDDTNAIAHEYEEMVGSQVKAF